MHSWKVLVARKVPRFRKTSKIFRENQIFRETKIQNVCQNVLRKTLKKTLKFRYCGTVRRNLVQIRRILTRRKKFFLWSVKVKKSKSSVYHKTSTRQHVRFRKNWKNLEKPKPLFHPHTTYPSPTPSTPHRPHRPPTTPLNPSSVVAARKWFSATGD